MGMFIVEKGTECKVIKDGKEWYASNFIDHKTKEDQVFDKGEMIVDPTGIAKSWCCTPRDQVIGGDYAKAGYYGFRRDGWAILVHHSMCKYC